MKTQPLKAETISSLGALAALKPHWWELWQRCPGATAFQTPAWLLAWWRKLSSAEPAVIAVSRGERLVALAPLWREEMPAGERLLWAGMPVSDHLDLLIDPAFAEQAKPLLMDAACALCWDRWEMDELPPQAAALQFEPPGGVTVELTDSSACPVLTLGSSLEECVPARRRRQLRRAIAAAQRRGAMEIVDASHDPQGFLDHLFALHAARWQGRGEEGVLADPAIQAFHRQAIEGLAGHGIARCRLLRIAGTIAGAWYGFAGRERVHAYLGGFDPDFAEESPGSILTGDAIGEAIATGAKEFDFLRGREDYKYKWGAVDRMNRRMVFTRRCAA